MKINYKTIIIISLLSFLLIVINNKEKNNNNIKEKKEIVSLNKALYMEKTSKKITPKNIEEKIKKTKSEKNNHDKDKLKVDFFCEISEQRRHSEEELEDTLLLMIVLNENYLLTQADMEKGKDIEFKIDRREDISPSDCSFYRSRYLSQIKYIERYKDYKKYQELYSKKDEIEYIRNQINKEVELTDEDYENFKELIFN